MQFYTIEKVGKNREVTPEGFLLIKGTPLARTGVQIYGPDETPVKSENGDNVLIAREENEVFRPQTIASANGKSLVDDHPEEDVDLNNWNELTLGIVIHPRRGEGADDDLLLGDILVTTAKGIKLIDEGKVELSCGYDAKYEEISPGRGRQYDIIINHVALVDAGRCGPRCKIGDSKAMAKKTTVWDRMLKTFGVKDAAELEEKLKGEEATSDEGGEEGDEHQHIHVHIPSAEGARGGMEEDSRMKDEDTPPKWFEDFKKGHDEEMKTVKDSIAQIAAGGAGKAIDKARDEEIEGELEEEAPEGTGDRARKARDSAYLGDSFQDTAQMAEIIAPGIRIPTFDSASDPVKTYDAICGLRRRALDVAYLAAETRVIMDDVLGGRTWDSKAPCAQVRTLFRAVGAARRRANNDGGQRKTFRDSRNDTVIGPIKSIADLNKFAKDFYKNQG